MRRRAFVSKHITTGVDGNDVAEHVDTQASVASDYPAQAEQAAAATIVPVAAREDTQGTTEAASTRSYRSDWPRKLQQAIAKHPSSQMIGLLGSAEQPADQS